jgi:hypothetical protein
MISFGRRGRENQRQFTKDAFTFKTNDRGHEFIEFARSETTNNHQGGFSDNNYETNPRMYATNKADCPVQALRKNLSKRNPTTDHFSQLSRPTINDRDLTWYTSRPIREKMLNNMMKNISKMANLAHNYTNHFVRATTVNIRDHAGISDREIMTITGHKCDASLTSYHTNQQKRKYAALLQGLHERPTTGPCHYPRKYTINV